MSALFGNKNIKDTFFGNKAVAAIYRGNKLVWERVVKQLESLFMQNQCFEFIPTEDIELNDVEFFSANNSSNTNAKLRILNEAGICIVYRDENGVQLNVTVYNLTGSLKTFTSLGTPTLFKDNIYYINIRGPYGDGDGSGMTGSKYIGFTGRQKLWSGIVNVNSVYSSTAWNHKCNGSAETFSEICQKGLGYFIWKGTGLNNQMAPSENGIGNPYPYLLKRDMSKVKHVFTDTEFGQYQDDIARYAFIYYTMGSTPGDEFVMNVGGGYGAGFAIDPNDQNTRYMTGNQHKIYTLQGSINENHITSMTPIDNEPSNPSLGAIYYKSSASTWTGGFSARAVVAWTGSVWEVAKNIDIEWNADPNYTAINYAEKVNDVYAKDFNNVSVTNGDKLYYRINGVEIF